MIHTFDTSMFFPLARDRVFEFFSDAGNLARITPGDMRFRVRTPPPIEIRQGCVIEYGMRAFGIPMRWRSLISRWDPPREFVDEQLAGPYKSWLHTHRFVERLGGTDMEDRVEYSLGWGPLGELAHPLVKRQLVRIFQFRRSALERILRA
jgi:ligand-binding SRPBCC domain-containing protein